MVLEIGSKVKILEDRRDGGYSHLGDKTGQIGVIFAIWKGEGAWYWVHFNDGTSKPYLLWALEAI